MAILVAQSMGDSFNFTLPERLSSEEAAAWRTNGRQDLKLTRDAAPLAKGGLVGYDDLKDFSCSMRRTA